MNAAAEDIKAFWDKQAEMLGTDSLATNPDQWYRNLEIDRILSHLTNKGSLLDVGCGNGFSTMRYAECAPDCKVLGIDYSELMIAQAQNALRKRKLTNISFKVGDVLKLRELKCEFDTVLTERCLINLSSFEEQKEALLELKGVMAPLGKLILVENTLEGLASLNSIRQRLDLPPISVRWHNKYIPQREFLQFARQHFTIEAIENIGNLYYLISRVVYAKLCDMEGKEPEYDHPINQIASQLPSLSAYSHSPNFLFVLRNYQ